MKRKAVVLVVMCLFLFVNSCDKEEKEEQYQFNMSNFFNNYLKTLCESSAKCKSGFVSSQNASFCPDVILTNPIAFQGFHKKEKVIFRHKYEMMVSAENSEWIEVDMKQADVCLSTVMKMEPCNPLDVQLLDIPECAKVFKGKKYVKQDCYQDEECENGWCDLRGGRCPGSCVEYKEVGQSCNSTLDRCAPGYICRTSGCSKASDGNPGDPCANDDDCNSFLFCRKTGNDALGNCFKRKSEGEPCIEANECVVGLSCVSNLCTRARISDEAGTPCGIQNEKDENDEFIVLECNSFSKLECGLQQTCQKWSKDSNMACFLYCDKGLFCEQNSKTCQLQGSIGRDCNSNEQCSSLYCYNKVCTFPECLEVEDAD